MDGAYLDLLYAELSHLEPSLVYARSFRPCPENIHLVGQVVLSYYPLSMLKEAARDQVSGYPHMGRTGGGRAHVLLGGVHEVELGLPVHQLLSCWVVPYCLHCLPDLRIDRGLRAGLDAVLHNVLAEVLVLL